MVTVEQIKDAIAKHKLELPRYQKLYDYYIGKHVILNRVLPDPTKPNHKVVTSYPTTIIDTVVGYFASKPLSYLSASNNEGFINELKRIFYLNDEEDTNAEITKNYSIFGRTFELHYIDELGNLRFKHYSPLEMYVEKDSGLSDSANELESWVNAYLVLGGMSGTTSEDLAKMKQDGAILVDDANSVKFLTKDVNPAFQQNHFETVDKLIHKFSGIPDLTSESFSSNLSGTALGFKVFNMESKAATKERKMEKSLRKRIRFICTILNKQGREYDPYDIRFNFIRNLPQNKSEIADQIVKLSPFVDQKTLLSWHPDITDVELVLKRLAEQSDSMELDNVKHLDEVK